MTLSSITYSRNFEVDGSKQDVKPLKMYVGYTSCQWHQGNKAAAHALRSSTVTTAQLGHSEKVLELGVTLPDTCPRIAHSDYLRMSKPVLHRKTSILRESLVAPQLLQKRAVLTDDDRILVFENGKEVLFIRTQLAMRDHPSISAHIFLAIPRSIAVALSAAIVGATVMTAAPVSPASPTLASMRGSGAAAVMVVAVLVAGVPTLLVTAAAAPAIGVTVAAWPGIAFAGNGPNVECLLDPERGGQEDIKNEADEGIYAGYPGREANQLQMEIISEIGRVMYYCSHTLFSSGRENEKAPVYSLRNEVAAKGCDIAE
ncbi:hypothetical protein B0H14DRAFT_2563057 [Mycena olivaceomarginata]|nr:hypothetical protein B0H14DRAFT_2563057 [Mycena olivaceomarginata]